MEMLLMGICISVFGLAVAVLAFGAATRPESAPAPARLEPLKAEAPARFFVDRIPDFASANPAIHPHPVPIQALLLQIENHVRLEQAAAESFIDYPSAALLHSKTASPFVN